MQLNTLTTLRTLNEFLEYFFTKLYIKQGSNSLRQNVKGGTTRLWFQQQLIERHFWFLLIEFLRMAARNVCRIF